EFASDFLFIELDKMRDDSGLDQHVALQHWYDNERRSQELSLNRPQFARIKNGCSSFIVNLGGAPAVHAPGRGGGGAIYISHTRLIGTRRTSPSLRMMSVEWNANADGSFAADSAVLDLLEPIVSGVW